MPVTNERRTGALWVAGTGAFLLLAAAAVFIAVRWSTIPDSGKLAVVGALTGSFLAAGRAIRRTLPATGDVLFHLGALLTPVDLAAVNLRLGAGWRGMLLSQGLLGTGVLGGLGLTLDSVVLRAAGIAGGVVLAAGVAATTSAPAPLVLAVFALAAAAVPADRRLRQAAVLWAGVAGLAPVLSTVASSVTAGAGVLADLGFRGDQRFVAAASGLIAAWVLGRDAARRRDLPMAVLAAAAAGVGLADGWFATGASDETNVVALAAVFAVVELVAALFRHDPFWSRPAGWLANTAEVAAGVAMLWVTGLVAAAPLIDEPFLGTEPLLQPAGWAAAALTLTGAAWVIGVLRRPTTSGLSALFSVLGALSGVAAVEIGTASTLATALALAAAGGAVLLGAEVLSPRPFALLGGVALAAWAPVTAWEHPMVMAVVGVAGAAVVIATAGRRDSVVLAVASMVVLYTGLVGASEWGPLLAVAGTWALAAAADHLGAPRSAALVRWAIGVPLVATAWFEPASAIAPAALATLACAVEALRTDDHRVAFGAAVTVQVLVATIAAASGLDAGAGGVALCVAAVVWAGLAALVVDDRWREPFLAAAGLGIVLGVLGAAADGRSLATATMLAGGLLVTVGITSRIAVVGHLGGALTAVGLAGHLTMSDVVASEPYLLPICLQLVAAGWIARRRDAEVSSWVAYAPAVVLLGGAAFAERLGGGAGWHAVVAGAVGVVAVAGGGWQRLAGPLFMGTALLVAVTVNESLHVVAGVPTWAWLATGGCTLLAAGVAMERHDTSPVEAGRRVVDLISERFE